MPQPEKTGYQFGTFKGFFTPSMLKGYSTAEEGELLDCVRGIFFGSSRNPGRIVDVRRPENIQV